MLSQTRTTHPVNVFTSHLPSSTLAHPMAYKHQCFVFTNTEVRIHLFPLVNPAYGNTLLLVLNALIIHMPRIGHVNMKNAHFCTFSLSVWSFSPKFPVTHTNQNRLLVMYGVSGTQECHQVSLGSAHPFSVFSLRQ